MSPEERKILSRALYSLNCSAIDYYNYHNNEKKQHYNFEVIGQIIFAKRFLAEMLDIGKELNNYLLPGEPQIDFKNGDNPEDWYNFCQKSVSSELTKKEKEILINDVLSLLSNVSGINDGDDACLRCAKRMIAEVANYEPLSDFRLLFEKEIKPKYFKVSEPSEE